MRIKFQCALGVCANQNFFLSNSLQIHFICDTSLPCQWPKKYGWPRNTDPTICELIKHVIMTLFSMHLKRTCSNTIVNWICIISSIARIAHYAFAQPLANVCCAHKQNKIYIIFKLNERAELCCETHETKIRQKQKWEVIIKSQQFHILYVQCT